MKKLIFSLYFITISVSGVLIVMLWVVYFILNREYPLMCKDTYVAIVGMLTSIYVFILIFVWYPSFKYWKN